MIRYTFTSLLVLLICSFADAQEPEEQMTQYILESKQLAEQGQVLEQVELMMEASKYLSEGDFSNVQTSSYIFQVASIPIDIPLLESKIDTQEIVLGKAYEFHGTKQFLGGAYLNAKASYQKSIELLSKYGLEYSAYRWLGVVSAALEEYENSTKSFEKAIVAAEKYFFKGHKKRDHYLFTLHTNITSGYLKVYNFRKARYHTNKAIEYAKASKNPTNIITSKILLAQLEIFVNGPEEGIEILDNIHEIEDDHPMIMPFYNFKASAYLMLESYEDALENYEKSITYIPDNPYYFPNKLLNKLGAAESKIHLGQSEAALDILNEGIDFYNQQGGKFSTALSDAYGVRAEAYIDLRNLSKARKDIESALALKGESEMIKITHGSRLATIYSKLYEETGEAKFIDSIYLAIAKNDKIISEVRENHRYYEDVLGLNDYVRRAYSSNLEHLGNLQKQNPERIKYDLVFKYFEGLKSYSLKEILKTDDAFIIGDITDDVLDEERRIKFRLSSIEKEIYNSESSRVQDSLSNILEKERTTYYSFLKQLELDHPNYYRFQYADKEYDLQSLQKHLGDSEAVIEYFLDKNQIYILVVDKANVRFRSVKKPDDWDERLDKFRLASTDVEFILDQSRQDELFQEFTNNSTYLYDILLADILQNLNPSIDNLVVIPDNELNVIPFGILIQPGEIASTNYNDLNYVIKDYTLSYEQTATDIIEQASYERDNTSRSYVGFAPRYGDVQGGDVILQGERMSDLPMARQSVNTIAELLNGKTFDEKSNISSFITEGSSADVLHLAMHGIIDQRDPQFSHFVFSDSGESKLYATDIYNLKLNNQLAVLSACNTGTGKIIDGDGVQNLARAFRFAGAESTIMSLWSVPDEQTADINLKFFKNLKDGQYINEALKNAKLSYLSSAPRLGTHPFFWAGFIPSGNTNKAIQFVNFSSSWLLFATVGVLIAILFLWFYTRKNKH